MATAAELLRKRRTSSEFEVPDEMIAKASRPSAAAMLKVAIGRGLVTPSTRYAQAAA